MFSNTILHVFFVAGSTRSKADEMEEFPGIFFPISRVLIAAGQRCVSCAFSLEFATLLFIPKPFLDFSKKRGKKESGSSSELTSEYSLEH